MDQREADIAERVGKLAQEKTAAEQKQHEYQDRIDALEKTREKLLKETHQEIHQWREQHLQQAKKDVESARQEWQQSLVREREVLVRELQSEIYRQTIRVTERLLTGLSDTQLQNRIADRFANQLAQTDEETAATLRTAHQTQNAVINTSHELSETEQQQVESAVRHLTGSDKPIAFHTRPELVCGVELQISGHRLAWSGRNALAGIESQLLAALDHQVSAPSEPASSSEDPIDSEVSTS